MTYIIERDTDDGWFPVELLDCDWRDIRGKAAAWAKALDCEVRVIDTRHKPSHPTGSNVIGHYGPEHAGGG